MYYFVTNDLRPSTPPATFPPKTFAALEAVALEAFPIDLDSLVIDDAPADPVTNDAIDGTHIYELNNRMLTHTINQQISLRIQ